MNYQADDEKVIYRVLQNSIGEWFVCRECSRRETNTQEHGAFGTKQEALVEMSRFEFDEYACFGNDRKGEITMMATDEADKVAAAGLKIDMGF